MHKEISWFSLISDIKTNTLVILILLNIIGILAIFGIGNLGFLLKAMIIGFIIILIIELIKREDTKQD